MSRILVVDDNPGSLGLSQYEKGMKYSCRS